KPWYARGAFWLPVFIGLLNVGVVAYLRSYASIVTLTAYALGLVLSIWFTKYLVHPVVLTGSAATILLSFSYATGMDVAISYRKAGIYEYLIKTDGGNLRAKLIRSGERGVLFHDEQSRRLFLLPWDEVKEISSDRNRLR